MKQIEKRRVWRTLVATGACLAVCATAALATPIDVQRSWCGTAVNTLLENGVVTAYPDGRFRPDHAITREEAAVLLLRLEAKLPAVTPPEPTVPTETTPEPVVPEETTPAPTGPEGTTPEPVSEEVIPGETSVPKADTPTPENSGVSPDSAEAGQATDTPAPVPEDPTPPVQTFWDLTPDRWSYADIQTLCARGLFSGYPDGRVAPEAPMTRAEFAVLLTRFLDARGALPANTGAVSFYDLNDSFAKDAVGRLAAAGILSGYPDGGFQPARAMTRGEVATVLYKLAKLPDVPPVVTIPQSKTVQVPYISQLYPYNAVVGCEATALLMGMQGKGYATDIGLPYFLEAMPKTKDNPALGFVGSPYVADKKKLTRTTIYPPVLASYAAQFGPVADFSDSSIAELQAELLAGNPVVIYATMRWETPEYRSYQIEGQTQWLVSNNHAVLLCGYDPVQGYYVADPYNIGQPDVAFFYWKDAATVEPIYMERQHAIVVR